jgi:sugar phosphate isomerase/epimerase
MNSFPFRLGTSSYIIPADILPNLRYLAGKVQDVELILFEVDDGPNNLPGRADIAEMRSLAVEHSFTFTVHLPLDLRLADDGSPRHISLEKARRVIDCTRDLAPWAYVLHLDGRSVLREDVTAAELARWQDQAVSALQLVGEWAGNLALLAVENLEGYPLDFYQPVLERVAVSRTVDVGHLWLDGHDPVAYLRQALPRTRVIHIHGISTRDHQSLAHAAPEKLRAVLDELTRAHYTGVLTLEIFSEDDFLTSLEAIQQAKQEGAAYGS